MTILQDYLEEQIIKFNEYHNNLLKNVTKDDIHKLRTTLKKLKAFNLLLDGLLFMDKDFPMELTKLFKMSGEIRDIQIQQSIVEEYDDNYKDYLSKLYNEKVSNFKIKESYVDELKYIKSKLDKVEMYHTADEILGIIQSKIKIISDEIIEMTNNISPSNLHEIRIKLKRIFYIFFMLKMENNANTLDPVQETIGLWHDYDVTIERIKGYDNNIEEINSLKEKRDSLYSKSLELIKNL